MSVEAVELVDDAPELSRSGVTVLWSGLMAPPETMLPLGDVDDVVLVDDVPLAVVSVVIEPPGLPAVDDVDDDGLVLDMAPLLEVSRLAVDLLMVTIWAQSSRSRLADADALPTPLTLPETLADGADARQVMLTLSPLLRFLREAAAAASTLSVRLVAPVVAGDAFKVTVRAVWSVETTSAVTAVVDDEVVELDVPIVLLEPLVLGEVEALDDGLPKVDDDVEDGLEDELDVSNVELVRVLAVDLLMAVTAEHWWSVAMSPLTSARALTLPLVVEVVEPMLALAVLSMSARQVRLTTSPAWMSFRLETALP